MYYVYDDPLTGVKQVIELVESFVDSNPEESVQKMNDKEREDLKQTLTTMHGNLSNASSQLRQAGTSRARDLAGKCYFMQRKIRNLIDIITDYRTPREIDEDHIAVDKASLEANKMQKEKVGALTFNY